MSNETKWAVLIEGAMKDARLAIGGLLVINAVGMVKGNSQYAMQHFAAGALAAVFAAAFAYLANLEYAGAVWSVSWRGLIIAKIFHIAAALCSLIGVALFSIGMDLIG